MTKKTPVIPLDDLLAGLMEAEKPLHPRYLYRMSDLEGGDLSRIKHAWPSIPLWRRRALLEDLENLSDDDLMLSFQAVGQIALQDEDPGVRQRAINVLWDYEDPRLVPKFIDLVLSDPEAVVRASAAGALAPFVYLGEIDEFPKRTLHKIEDSLLKVMSSGDESTVRRSALEALGYSSRPEVPALIQSAYDTDDVEWVGSALYAMSRTASISWKSQVMDMLESESPSLRKEAARAAGELELEEAVPILLQMLVEPDQDVRLASLWSLSQIGGDEAQEALQSLYEAAEDDEELELIEDALDNLSFTEDIKALPFFDMTEEDLEFLESDDDAHQGEDEADGDKLL